MEGALTVMIGMQSVDRRSELIRSFHRDKACLCLLQRRAEIGQDACIDILAAMASEARRGTAGHHRERAMQKPSEMGRHCSLTDTVARRPWPAPSMSMLKLGSRR